MNSSKTTTPQRKLPIETVEGSVGVIKPHFPSMHRQITEDYKKVTRLNLNHQDNNKFELINTINNEHKCSIQSLA